MIPDIIIYGSGVIFWAVYQGLWLFKKRCVCKEIMQFGVAGGILTAVMALDLLIMILFEPNGFTMGTLSNKKTIVLMGCLAMMGLGLQTCITGYIDIFKSEPEIPQNS